MFSRSFYWLISLFISFTIIPYTQPSLPRKIFWLREKRRRNGVAGGLFSIFSLITNQYISLRRPGHSVRRRTGSFARLFICLLFNTFPSLLPGISPASKCQTNKARKEIPLPPPQTGRVFFILIKSQLRWSHLREQNTCQSEHTTLHALCLIYFSLV